MGNTQLMDFLKEAITRLLLKSPRFFFVFQCIGAALTIAGYIPTMLQNWFNVEVPDNFVTMCKDISKYSAGFFAASLLPVKTKPVAQTESGDAIKVTDEKKMPFTAKSEAKDVEKIVPPPPVVPQVPEPPGNS